jgi:catechol 2,3-dioxygenase-like lactoylglutathione lyase family enzyme
MLLQRLHHVQLAMPAEGEARAREFYAGLLGIPEVPKPPDHDPFGNRLELMQATGRGA